MIRGWEFFILNPFDNITDCTQDMYLSKYNNSYQTFLKQLCIPDPNDLLKEGDFLYFINCEGENDTINKDDDYEYKFKKSVFFEKKYKRIKKDIIEYYNQYNIIIDRIYKTNGGFIIYLKVSPL